MGGATDPAREAQSIRVAAMAASTIANVWPQVACTHMYSDPP